MRHIIFIYKVLLISTEVRKFLKKIKTKTEKRKREKEKESGKKR